MAASSSIRTSRPIPRSEKRRTHSRARRPGASLEECHKPLPRRYRSWLSQKWERPVGTLSNGSPPKERSPTLVCGWTGPVASHSDSNNDSSFAGTGQSSSERFIILAPLRNRRTPAIVLPKQYERESNSRSQPKSESAQGRKPVRTRQNICDGMLEYSGDARSSCQPSRSPVPNVKHT